MNICMPFGLQVRISAVLQMTMPAGGQNFAENFSEVRSWIRMMNSEVMITHLEVSGTGEGKSTQVHMNIMGIVRHTAIARPLCGRI